MPVAATNIKHDGKDIPAGTKVNKSDFGDGWDALVEAGAIAKSMDEVEGSPPNFARLVNGPSEKTKAQSEEQAKGTDEGTP